MAEQGFAGRHLVFKGLRAKENQMQDKNITMIVYQ